MNTKHESGQGVVEFVLILTVVAILLILLLPSARQAAEAISKALGSSYQAMPKTDHGTYTHQYEKWNVQSISNYFDTDKCKPHIYACPSKSIEVHYCKTNYGQAIGLIIDTITNAVITGFESTSEYWTNRCK